MLILISCLTLLANDEVQSADDIKQFIKQAEKLTRKGKFDEAEIILRRVILQNPSDSSAKLSLAYVLLKKQDIAGAYKYALEIAKTDTKNARAFAVLGVTLLNLGNFKDARLILAKAYQLDKKEPLAWFGAGMLDFYENRIPDSLPKLLEAEFLDSAEPDFTFSLAQVLARAEKYSEAGDAYERFLRNAPISDTERRLRIKGLISFLRYLGSKRHLYLIDKDVEQTTVPIELTNLRPIIEVGINGKKEKFRFVLDTGSGISVISDKTAQRLKIKPVARGGLARAIGGDGKFEIVYGFINSLTIGEAKIQYVPVYIRKFHDDGGGEVDGYIGLSLISKFLTTVDYGNLSFTLSRKNKNSIEKFESEAPALPLRLTSSGFLSGEVQIEGIESPLNFIVDTGASVSVISNFLANSVELSRFQMDEKMRVVGAAGVTENVDLFMLPRVTFGSHSGEGIRAISLNLDVINEASGFQQAGILGGNFLQNYRLTFDFQNSKVTFVPNKK
ncbi:MAG: aspartyl protease family protein [Pyrinomonadaceae bacterium]